MEKIGGRGIGHRFLLGCCAGVSSSVILQPFDVFKTKLQGNILYKNEIFGSYRSLFANLKLSEYWKGISPTVARASLGPGIYFALLETLNYNQSSGVTNFLKGALARSIASSVVNPLTVLKVRYEFSRNTSPGLYKGIKKIISEEGIKGLNSGLLLTLLRDVPQSGIYLAVFTSLKRKSNSTTFCALTAGVVSTICSAPIDMMKTIVQLKGKDISLRDTFKHEWKLLFRGISPRLVRKPLQMAISWIIYDNFR